MIYIKQYNSLFDSPRVEEPKRRKNAFSIADFSIKYSVALHAYNKWLSSKIEVIGDHTWQDLQEVQFGVHYRLEEGKCKKPFDASFLVAIPITPKPTIGYSETAPLNKHIEGLVLGAYYAGFNQAHYGHLHPEVCPPKECESAGIEYLESKKTHIQFVLKRTQKPDDLVPGVREEEQLGRIRTKIADTQIGELVKEHLSWNPTELRMASAKYFTESGTVSGSLYHAIETIAKQFAEFAIEQPLINKYKNQFLESREEDSLASDNEN